MKRATSKHHSGLWELVMATLNNFLPFYKVTKWIEWTGHDNNLQLQPWWDPRRCFGSKRSCWGSFCNFLCRLWRTPGCGCAGLWSVCVSCGGYVMCCAVCSLSFSLSPEPPSIPHLHLPNPGLSHTHLAEECFSLQSQYAPNLPGVSVIMCVCVCGASQRCVSIFLFPSMPSSLCEHSLWASSFYLGVLLRDGTRLHVFLRWTADNHTPRSLALILASFFPSLPLVFLSFFTSDCSHTHTHTHTQDPFFSLSPASSCMAISLSVPVRQPIIQSVSKSASLPESPLFHFFLFSPTQRCCFSLYPSIMLPISHFHCQNMHLITSATL